MRFRHVLPAVLLFSSFALTAQKLNCSPQGSSTCNPSQVVNKIGDSPVTSGAEGTTSLSSLSGTSSASNASGVNIAPVIDTKVTTNQDAKQSQQQSGNFQQQGQQSANADANGNLSNNDNKSNAQITNNSPATATSSTAPITVGVAPVGTSSSTSQGGSVGAQTLKTGDSKSDSTSAATAKSDNALTANGGQGGTGGKSASKSASTSKGGDAAATGGNAAGGDATGGKAASSSKSAGGTASTGAQSFTGSTGGSSSGGNTVGGSNSATTVDASTHTANNSTYDGRALVQAPITQNSLPAMNNAGGLLGLTIPCGPRMKKEYREVYATHFGFFGSGKRVLVGESEDVKEVDPDHPYKIDYLGNGRYMYTGSMMVGAIGKVGVATNKGVSGGGNQGSNFAALAASVGTSSATEAIEKGIVIAPCSFVVEPPPPPAPVAVAAPAPVVSASVAPVEVHVIVDEPTGTTARRRRVRVAPVNKCATYSKLANNACSASHGSSMHDDGKGHVTFRSY